MPKIKAYAAAHPASTRPHAADAPSNAVGTSTGPGFFQAPYINLTPDPSATGDANEALLAVTMDVNNDGKPDLVALRYDGTLNVLLNPGTGALLSAVSNSNTSAVSDDPYFVSATAVDLNNDGYTDIAAIDEENCLVWVFLNHKDGTFSAATSFSPAFNNSACVGRGGSNVVFGDVSGHGNGVVDMVAVGQNNSSEIDIETYIGNGDGTFAAPTVANTQNTVVPNADFMTGTYALPNQLALVDMNNDGKLDLVAAVLNSTTPSNLTEVAVLAGTGTGSFATFPTMTSASPGAIVSTSQGVGQMYVGLVDADSSPDVLLDDQSGNLYFMAGSSTGTLGAPTAVLTNLSGDGVDSFLDVNNDGKLDVVADSYGYFSVYAGNGDGTFSNNPYAQFAGGDPYYGAPQPADFNGDGKIDIVSLDSDSGLAGLFLGTANGFSGAPVAAPLNVNADLTSAILTADLDGNGTSDLVAYAGDGSDNEYLASAMNDGHGNFTYQPAISAATVATLNLSYVEPLVVDLNGDQKPDLLLATETGLLEALGNGDGTFATPVAIDLGTTIQCPLSFGAAADLNGDGTPDLVFAYPGDTSCGDFQNNTSSGYFTLLSNGVGGYTASFTQYGGELYQVELADFNNDGVLDMAVNDVSDSEGEGISVFAGQGAGLFNYTTPVYSYSIAAFTLIPGDFNGDGNQDLTVGGFFEGNNWTGIQLLAGGGDFTFHPLSTLTPDTIPLAGQYADLNGDGKLDLALALSPLSYFEENGPSPATTSLTYLINLGGGSFSLPTRVFSNSIGRFDRSAPDDYSFLLIADYNGDHAPDIIAPSGDISGIFYNAGAVVLSLTSSAPSAVQGSSVTFTTTLTPTVGSAVPTGTVSFYSNGALVGIEPVASGSATLTLSSLQVGADAITAVYSGDANYNAASSSTSVTTTVAPIGSVTLKLTTSAASVTQGGAVTLTLALTPSSSTPATGTVSFYSNGVLAGIAPVSSNNAVITLTSLPLGSDTITAVYSGDANYASKSATSVTTTIAPIGSVTLKLASSAPSLTQGAPVTFTVALTPSSSTQATGTVTFYDNGKAFVTVPVSGNAATLTLSTLPVGTNVITVAYSGDGNYASLAGSPSVQTSVTVTAATTTTPPSGPGTFTMAAGSTSSLDLTVGQTGTVIMSVTGNAAFNGTIAFTCAGAPSNTTCTILPSSVTLTGAQTASVGVVLATTAPNNHYDAANRIPDWIKTTGGVTLAGGLLLLWPGRRRRNVWMLLVLGVAGLGATAGLTGCAHKYSGTPVGSYTVAVTATAGSITQSSKINLTVHD